MYHVCTGDTSTRLAAMALAVGAPPVAAEAVHLLGGDELGAAPGDLGLLRSAASSQLRAVELGDAQATGR